MGARTITNTIISTDVVKGFKYLVEQAIINSGEDAYNGTISTCSLGICKLRFDSYKESNLKEAKKIIEKDLYTIPKGIADFIDLGVIEYRVKEVKRVKNSNIKTKYELRYLVKQKDFSNQLIKGDYMTKEEAEKAAIRLTIETEEEHIVTKEYVLVKGYNNLISETEITYKSYKNKPRLKPHPNREIMEMHKYVYFGWALE